MVYDIFYVSKHVIGEHNWKQFRSSFPSAQKIDNVKSFDDIKQKAFTKFFWVIWDDLNLIDLSIFEFRVSKFEEEFIHVFKNRCNGVESYFGGVVLFPKNCKISSKEFQHRFYLNKKEHDIVASKYCYPVLKLTTYDAYVKFATSTSQPLFWGVWSDIEIINDNIFDLYFDPNDGKYEHDRNENHMFLNNTSYDGVMLASKNKIISKKEFDHRFLVDKKEWSIVVSKPKPFDVYYLNSYEEFLSIKESATSEMFWVVWNDVNLFKDFAFDYYVPVYDTFHRNITHIFKNGEFYDGICLFSKHKNISKNEFDHRFFIDKVEVDIVASTPKQYDQYIINNYDDYLTALNSTHTEMFWGIWSNVNVSNQKIFDTYFNHHARQSRTENHVFKNACNDQESFVNGVILFSKNTPVSKKEIDHKFLINKKEYDIVVSQSQYPKYIISSYDKYLGICQTETQPLFWCVWPDIEIIDDSIFDFYFDPFDGRYDHDRSVNHVFKNSCNGVESYLSGVTLFSTDNPISEREFNLRFLVDKKEHDLVISKYRYPRYVINSYQEYIDILENETRKMFWCIWPDIEVIDSKIFDFYFDPNDGKYDYDRSINHMFKNRVGNEDFFISGLALCSTEQVVSKKEFEHRFFIDKKEYDCVVSKSKLYDKFVIEKFEDYKYALETSSTDMFWTIPAEVEPLEDFKFDLQFPYQNNYERSINHVFKNKDVEEIKYNGIMLLSKQAPISAREIEYRYLIEKKEYDVVASKLKLYDIVFISYNEPNADENFTKLIERFPRAKRVHGVKGIHQAHIAAAKLATTPMFWVVDGDAVVEENFKFNLLLPKHDTDIVHVWLSRNPVNDLKYGYGGVKLLPKHLTENMDVNQIDMTMSISDKFKVVQEVSNITAFNTDPFNTWKSAFRECVKLASRPVDPGYQEETEDRLHAWCILGGHRPNGKYAIQGAKAGKKYGVENISNPEELAKINDFDWLLEQFQNPSPLA